MINELNRNVRFPMNNLQFFAEEPPAPETEPETGAKSTAEEPEKTPEAPEAPSKTFTQEDLDRIVADRIARERKKFADYDDIRKKAEEYEKALEEKRLAELSEKERAEEIAKKFEAEKLQLAQELETLRESMKREKINAEFIRVATSHNIAYVEDAMRLADLAAVTIDEDGKVVGVEEAVKALVEHKPFLLAQAKKEPKTIGTATNHSAEQAEKTSEQLLKEAAEKARRTGRPEDFAAYSALKLKLNGS
jgi:uncharacterized protein YuzE